MEIISLNGIWQLRGRRQEGAEPEEVNLQARVPGCVQLDLSREGYLPKDLFFGENILQAQAYEDYEWWYTRTFTLPKGKKNAYLVLEGVDCIAEYFLNGVLIGESQNMLIPHEFEVSEHLREGENVLVVHVRSSVIAAHYDEYSVTSMMSWGSPWGTTLRRAPHSYGWDIMPRAVTAGLWREVRLEFRDKLSFSQVYFKTTATDCRLLYEIRCRWEDFKDVELEAVGHCGDSRFSVRKAISSGKAGKLVLPIENPKTWWPYGYGEANVYDAVLRLYQGGELVHEESASFGLRTVKLDATEATDGKTGRFRLLINDTEIMCKGSNWVPLDAFHCRDAQRYEQALALVKDVGCNILRCWGGNVYEQPAFFDFCDRNGVMVWQDFAMACRVYPQSDLFRRQMEQELRVIVRRLRNHPSLVLWAGDNEVDQMISAYTDPAGNRITREWIPAVLWENDMGRPYLPSSPYLSPTVCSHKGSLVSSEDHVWGPRDYFKSSYYRENRAHFISEIGYHGCPSPDSVKKFISPDKLWPYQNNSEWILHSSDQNGNDARVMLMEKQVRQLFGTIPESLEDFALASQISQAEAKKYFIERMRAGRPTKTGIIWWNLLDGWPQFSDAVVDYYFTKKLAYSYIKRSQAPFCILADEIANWNVKLFACNDTLQETSGRVTVTDAQSDELLFEGSFTASANASTCIGKIPVFYSQHRLLLIRWTANGKRGWNHYLCGYPPFDLAWYQGFLSRLSSEEDRDQ